MTGRVLHGIEDFQIARKDTLQSPAFTDGAGGLAKFDCVIANPPFSLDEWAPYSTSLLANTFNSTGPNNPEGSR